MGKKQIVVGFSNERWGRFFLNPLTDRQKYELYLQDDTALSYDSVKDFLITLTRVSLTQKILCGM